MGGRRPASALSYIEQMRYVILPQAFGSRSRPTVGFSVQVIKGTALASIIGFVELTKAGTMLNNATFRPFMVYFAGGADLFLPVLPAVLVRQANSKVASMSLVSI